MANKRNLKKDVNFLTDEYFADSFALMVLYNDESDKKIIDAMQKVADARNKLIETIQNYQHKGLRISTIDRKEGKKERSKALKAKLAEGFKTFITALEDGYEVLGKLNGEN